MRAAARLLVRVCTIVVSCFVAFPCPCSNAVKFAKQRVRCSVTVLRAAEAAPLLSARSATSVRMPAAVPGAAAASDIIRPIQPPASAAPLAPATQVIRFSVQNDGAEIPAEEQPLLFKPFGQTMRGIGKHGTGLGLTICKALVEAHGGTIGFTSSPGEPTVFAFEIPFGVTRQPPRVLLPSVSVSPCPLSSTSLPLTPMHGHGTHAVSWAPPSASRGAVDAPALPSSADPAIPGPAAVAGAASGGLTSAAAGELLRAGWASAGDTPRAAPLTSAGTGLLPSLSAQTAAPAPPPPWTPSRPGDETIVPLTLRGLMKQSVHAPLAASASARWSVESSTTLSVTDVRVPALAAAHAHAAHEHSGMAHWPAGAGAATAMLAAPPVTLGVSTLAFDSAGIDTPTSGRSSRLISPARRTAAVAAASSGFPPLHFLVVDDGEFTLLAHCELT